MVRLGAGNTGAGDSPPPACSVSRLMISVAVQEDGDIIKVISIHHRRLLDPNLSFGLRLLGSIINPRLA